MDTIQGEILEHLKAREITGSEMPRVEVEKSLSELRNRFCDRRDFSSPLWEAISVADSYYKDLGVLFTDTFFATKPGEVLFLIDDWKGMSGVRLNRGTAVPVLLRGMYSFRWYATDPKYSFLVCRNDHEFIIHAKGVLRDSV